MLTSKPRKGDRVAWRLNPGEPLRGHATVLRIEGNLCWVKPDDGEPGPFIWFFPRENML